MSRLTDILCQRRIMRLFTHCLCAAVFALLTGAAHAEEVVKILTLNVAGLPDMLTDQNNPQQRMRAIAERANHYDVVAYQEDFYESEYLDQHSTQTFRLRGTDFRWWDTVLPWMRKSGLTLESRWPLELKSFRSFSTCHGYLQYKSDCWVPKGMMCSRTVTNDGIFLDICTTHFDAGKSPGDNEARRKQLAEYEADLPAPVIGAPWLRVETGDFNMHPDDPLLQPLLASRDVFNVSVVESTHERDYIMLTHNDLLDMQVLRLGRVPDFHGLSDHPAIEAVLRLKTKPYPYLSLLP
ncbi:MAG: hypothetical protein PVF89_00540 [Lysobacterales bacterium]